MSVRRLVTVAAAGVVLLPVGASASVGAGPDIPELSAAALEESVVDLDLEVHDIETDIQDLESPVEGEGDTAVALNSDILFGFDESRLSTAAVHAIGDVVEDLPQNASVTITGHTDDVGEDAYNQELSTRRATAVEKAVRKARPDLDTTARGRGSADPVEPNSTGGEDNPGGRAKNRRVEISYE